MKSLKEVFISIPEHLREPSIREYLLIAQNYFEGKWLSSELHGGRFCEIVYCILVGVHSGSYPSELSKPKDFVGACRALESNTSVPRSFQILLPRLLPSLYEVRNSRNVGHVGGDVDSNSMDSSFVFSSTSWIIAELVRFFHDLSAEEAQAIVERLTERKLPLVWVSENTKRILDSKMSKKHQTLVLLCQSVGRVDINDLQGWIEYKNKSDFMKMLKRLHNERMVELDIENKNVQILPPGEEAVANKIVKRLT